MQEMVNPDDVLQFQGSQAPQKFSQGGRFGEVFQAQEVVEAIVVMENSGRGDAFHTSYHGIKYSQDQVGWMVDGLSSSPTDMSFEDMPEIQFSTKSLKDEHSTIVSKRRIFEEKIDISDTFSHLTNMHPVGAFLAEYFDGLNYNSFSSEILISLSQKHKFFAFFQELYLFL